MNGRPIHVSEEKKLDNAFLLFCHGNTKNDIARATHLYSRLKLEGRDLRQIGSAAIECSWVASGKVEAFFAPGGNSWDVAAGVLLVRNAGGLVTDMLGHEWNFNSNGVIASNRKINDALITKIKNIK